MAIPLLQDERIDIDAVEGAGEVDDLKAGGFCQLARPSPLLGLASGREQRRQIAPHLPHAIRSTQPLDAAIAPAKQGSVARLQPLENPRTAHPRAPPPPSPPPLPPRHRQPP